MRFIEYMGKLETIKHLSQRKCTGTPQSLARKLHVSERTIQRMVQQLREQGCRVLFNWARSTYKVKNE